MFDGFKHLYSAAERRAAHAILETPWLCNRLAARRGQPIDGRTLDAQVAAMLALDDLVGRSDLRKLSPVRARERVAAEIRVVGPMATAGVASREVEIPGPAGSIPARVFVPDGIEAPSPAVVFIHGGGWVTGSVETHDGICRALAIGARCRVVSIEYRLAPEHRFPAAVDDSLAATRWLFEHADALGINSARVAVAGDSAGGNLSAVVARRTRNDSRRVALQVLLYPALDATYSLPSHQTLADGYFLTRGMCDWYYAHYAGDCDRRHPDLSPLLAPDVSDVPALVYTAGFDPLRDEGQAYAERLRAAGTRVMQREFPGLVHGFVGMTHASRACRRTAEEVAVDVGRELRC